MQRVLVAIVIVAGLVASFFIGAAWGAEPEMSGTGAGSNAGAASRRLVSSDLVPVPGYLFGADTGAAVLARTLQVEQWNRAWWNEIAAQAGVAGHGDDTALGPEREGTDPSVVRGVVPSPQPSGSGDCYDGSPIPASVVTRESGGQPFIVNPSSGAFGCYQLMPMHYAAGGTCEDLDRSVEGQKACASRLPASAWSL